MLVAWNETRSPDHAEVLLLPQVATDVEATGRTVLGRYTVTTASIRGWSPAHPNGHELPREPHRGDDFRQRTGRASKALPASRDEMSEQVAHDGSTMTAPTTPVSTTEHANLWFDAIITGAIDVSTLSAEHVGRLVHGLAHGLARDAAMSTALCTKGDNSVMDEATKATVTAWNSTASLSTLTERMRLLARRAPDVPVTAHLLGVLAITAYADKNVALATVAIERAGSRRPQQQNGRHDRHDDPPRDRLTPTLRTAGTGPMGPVPATSTELGHRQPPRRRPARRSAHAGTQTQPGGDDLTVAVNLL